MPKILLIAVLVILGAGAFYLTYTADSRTDSHDGHTEVEGSRVEVGAPAGGDQSAATGNAVGFDVKGTDYSYDVKTIRVKKGDTVTINFESTDGFHDWVLDEFNAATERVRPGTPTSVTFVADKTGTFEYYCSVGSHRAQGMVGSLIVE